MMSLPLNHLSYFQLKEEICAGLYGFSLLIALLHGSCHFDRALNVEIGVEFWMIFIVVFFYVAMYTFWGTFMV